MGSSSVPVQGSVPGATITPPSQPKRNQKAYEFFRRMGSPKYICAPMVLQSELAFRMLVRHHGATLCYTPMIHADQYIKGDEIVKKYYFETCEGDRPLIAQFCGDDPETVLQATMLIQDQVDAVDLNLGCPQKTAERQHFGAYLLEEPELVSRIVSTLAKNLSVPVTCKIRLRKTLQETLDFALMLERSGCSMLTVHGRRKEQRHHEGIADWDAIRAVKQALSIPVIANGNVLTLDDVHTCMEYTGCEGVMSAMTLLRDPCLFNPNVTQDAFDSCFEYLRFTAQYPTPSIQMMRDHLLCLLQNQLRDDHVELWSILCNTAIQTTQQYEEVIHAIAVHFGRIKGEAKSLHDIKYGNQTRVVLEDGGLGDEGLALFCEEDECF